MSLTEFQIIEQFFTFVPQDRQVLKGIGDDAAVLQYNDNWDLLWSVDTLVEGIHFSKDSRAEDVAYKAVAVNVSDIAAMGGEPKWINLSLGLPDSESRWLQAFSHSLGNSLSEFSLSLVGGDTVKSPTLSLSIGILGRCEKGKAMLRSGANAGDSIYVTGKIGDAALALKLLSSRMTCSEALLNRLHRPTPRVAEGRVLIEYASAAIDISDGLLGDLNHILVQSNKSARIERDKLPFSTEVARHLAGHHEDWDIVLRGGEEYELCFTVSADREQALLEQWNKRQLSPITKIGIVEETGKAGIVLVDSHGQVIQTNNNGGFQHF